MLKNRLFNNEEFIVHICVTQLLIKQIIHVRHDHVCLSTPARLKHSTLKSKFVHAKILSCARPHARTMQSYKARLLYVRWYLKQYQAETLTAIVAEIDQIFSQNFTDH